MYVPNLLQFVPNDYIANNYLKSNFYLKDVLCYRKVEEKITGTVDCKFNPNFWANLSA